MPNTNHQVLWGDIFEITVKRGIIHYLLDSKLLATTHTSIQPWVTYTIHDLRHHLNTQLAATDQNYLNLAHHYLDHLLVVGYGLGWTCIREVIQKFNTEPSPNELQLTALWCPLTLRDRRSEQDESDQNKTEKLQAFWQALHLNGQSDYSKWLEKGGPVHADFFLLLEITSIKSKLFLLCLEFSLNVPPRLEDFSESEAHLHQLENYMYLMEKRGVFTRLNSEISDDVTAFSSELASYISAFTSSDKPLFKLCQASSYLTLLADELHRINSPLPLEVQALAITAAGIEGLSARFDTTVDPRIKLLKTLGKTYRTHNATEFNDPESLHAQLNFVLDCIQQALPKPLQQELNPFLHNPPIGEELRQVITETITEFHNPDTSVSLNELPKWIDSNEEVTTLLGQVPHLAIYQILQNLPEHNPKLRDLHAAAVWAGLNATKSGQINVLALEGYPGIGKTTAVKDWLHQQTTGFLFFYFSPRVVINSKVKTELGLNNVLTLTSDSLFINNATSHFIKKAKSPPKINSFLISAVAFAGIDETKFLRPEKGILFLNTSQVQELDQYGEYSGSYYNFPVSKDRSLIDQNKKMGVWKTLAMAARQALEANFNLNRIAITAAIQGYREFNNSTTTVDSLSNLFQHLHHKQQGKSERQRLAERLPTIVVMIDEITGDSAGVLATNKLCSWLEQEFISPFGNNSPFRVILIIADASLSNAQILQRHVESVNGHAESITSVVPDKILISHSYGIQPLRLIAKSLDLGLRRSLPTLHIEAFGFPAAAPLTLRYDLRFMPLIRPPTPLNELSLTPRRVISDAAKLYIQKQAQELIIQSLKEISGQIIFFAQDREFLETVASELKEWAKNNANFSDIDNKIVTLHSKVTQKKRDQLIQPEIRDSMRVILMTSSGSRGVSFPKATHIIALIPRFNIETNLMELAQLIYRGRGYYSDPNQPEVNISGDHAQRILTFLINDFVISDTDTEPEVRLNQWARQALDFLTFVILLRATILTRISGNAGLPLQQLAMVPVGNISSSEFSVLLADSVRSIMVELKVLLADSNHSNKSGLKSVLQRIENLFRNAEYKQNKPSISTNGIAQQLSFSLTNDTQTLVHVSAQKIIPDNVYCIGPLWLEYMQNVNTDEQYEFELFYAKQQEIFQSLHNQLNALNRDSTLPQDLRQQAKKLYTILDRTISDDAIQYTAVKSNQPHQIWNCFPANYPYFMSISHSNNKILDHEGWWDTLNRSIRSVCSVSSVFPALPVYKSKPFLMIITSGDPTDLQRALDDRYFCASSEVNLLNALLFA